MSVGAFCSRWSLSFVGTRSCMTRYQVIRVDSDNEASLRFFHTHAQSMCDQLLCTRVFCSPATALNMVCTVMYKCFLYAFMVSMCPLGAKYADAVSYRCRLSRFAGVLLTYVGFFTCSSSPHLYIQSAVIVPFLACFALSCVCPL